jgi:hypothetical protein
MELLDNLQHLVTEDLVIHPDGELEEVQKFHVEQCGKCEALRLRPGHGEDD